jgi:hypothetical protein
LSEATEAVETYLTMAGRRADGHFCSRLSQVGMRHSAAAKSAACRATSELVNSFTDYRTIAEAVSSEMRRQLDRQREGLALLAGEGMPEKVSEQGPNSPPVRRRKRV